MENIDEGVFYSDSVGREEEITASLADEPDKIGRPSLTIRKVEPKEPTVGQEAGWGNANAKTTGEKWRMKGEVVL